MSDTIKSPPQQLALDRAFQYAVILAWEDLMKPAEAHAIYVEYLFDPSKPMDHVTAWSVKATGREDLVCECWIQGSPAHPGGTRFENDRESAKLSRALDFIMENQSLFSRATDAAPEGFVQIHLPSRMDRVEAATWIKTVAETESEQGDSLTSPHRASPTAVKVQFSKEIAMLAKEASKSDNLQIAGNMESEMDDRNEGRRVEDRAEQQDLNQGMEQGRTIQPGAASDGVLPTEQSEIRLNQRKSPLRRNQAI